MSSEECWDESKVAPLNKKWTSEDVGMLSQADETSRKLQCSLDELIEQTASTTNANPRKNQFNRKNHSNQLNSQQNQRTIKNQSSYKQILRNKKYGGNSYATRIPYPPPFFYNPLMRPMLYAPSAPGLAPFPHPVNAGANVELALAEIEISYPPMVPSPNNPSELVSSSTESLLVRFKQTYVVKVLKQRGELVLDSGGWKTVSTRFIINTALKPLGLWVELDNKSSGDKENSTQNKTKTGKTSESDWKVVDGMSYLAAFSDGMVIGQVGAQSLSQMLARASVIAQHLKQMKNNALAKFH